jgi:hypothetical protein
MKFEPTRLIDYSDESIIAEIKRVAKEHCDSEFRPIIFKRKGRVGMSTIRRRFGSWEGALQAAGLSQLYIGFDKPRIDPLQARDWSKEMILEELRRVALLIESKTLTVAEFRKEGRVGDGTIRSRFGSWNKALKEAGLDIVNHGKRYSDLECHENLLDVWTHLGRQPKYREMQHPPSKVGGKAYTKRWGTWSRAIHAFVEYVESEFAEDDKVSKSAPQPEKRKNLKAEDLREPRVGLRYKVLKRDSFRCALCGRSPANEVGCELHIDHIIPFAKGGKTVEENLRVLCDHCNLGKSDKE